MKVVVGLAVAVVGVAFYGNRVDARNRRIARQN
jgi:hypothetical protein